jgi:hypothetical protein
MEQSGAQLAFVWGQPTADGMEMILEMCQILWTFFGLPSGELQTLTLKNPEVQRKLSVLRSVFV